MSTVRQYYDSDFHDFIGPEGPVPLEGPDGAKLEPPVMWKMLLGFDSRAAFFVVYVPELPDSFAAAKATLDDFDWILKIKTSISLSTGFAGESMDRLDDCVFTGRAIFYVESDLSEEARRALEEQGAARQLAVIVRDRAYMRARDQRSLPHAFIAHDSRDKDAIARPLAVSLSQNMCRVWYDEFSLQVGDSLREKIEHGLKTCKRCILVLTPEFLNNEGWPKKEFDSVFTRDLLHKESIVLPVWAGVSSKDVFNYSPSLANRVGVDWRLGIEEVSKRLLKAIL